MRRKRLTASALAVAVLFVLTMATPSWAAPPIPCSLPTGAVEIKGNISAGAGCDLSGATVKGNVTVNPGGSLKTKKGSTTVITGDVQSNGATEILLTGATSVGGDVRLTGTTKENDLFEGNVGGNVEIEEGATESELFGESVGGNVRMLNGFLPPIVFFGLVGIDNSSVGGNVDLGNNSLTNPFGNFVAVLQTTVAGDLRVYSNSTPPGREGREPVNSLFVEFSHIGGNAELLNNRGFGKEIGVTDNTVGNNLICTGNEPRPTELAGENTAKHKFGQCERL